MPCTCGTQAKTLSDGHISNDALGELFQKTFERRRTSTKSDLTCTLASSSASFSSLIDHVNEDIAYDEFFVKYIFGNRPCIIGKWITRDWKATSDWIITNDTSGKSQINFSKLESLFGNAQVPVADCSSRYYNSQCKVEMVFTEYLSYLKRARQRPEERQSTDQCLYLKDWHFHRQFPEYNAYKTPKFFNSDWLNYTCDLNSCDDYRFVYIGPKDSWTPFHADVYRSFSWSANVCGRKRWLLFPPDEETKMKDGLGNLPYDVTDIIATRNDINFIDVVQNEGEVIFVPSGWYHQVQNIEDTISINHNWLNAANISLVTQFISSQAALVRSEINDCKALMNTTDWNNQCEVILKADSGMNIHDFVKFLDIIACSRSALLYCKGWILSQISTDECSSTSFSDLADIINATTKFLPLSECGVADPQDQNNEYNHEIAGLCFRHAMFDLYKLLDAIESIRDVCEEIADRVLVIQLDGMYTKVLRFFRDFMHNV